MNTVEIFERPTKIMFTNLVFKCNICGWVLFRIARNLAVVIYSMRSCVAIYFRHFPVAQIAFAH